jgi:hypothetical protein
MIFIAPKLHHFFDVRTVYLVSSRSMTYVENSEESALAYFLGTLESCGVSPVVFLACTISPHSEIRAELVYGRAEVVHGRAEL